MALSTRSPMCSATQRTNNEDLILEATFRRLHRTGHVLVNPSDLDPKRRIMWWATGLREGTIVDSNIPEQDRDAVQLLLDN